MGALSETRSLHKRPEDARASAVRQADGIAAAQMPRRCFVAETAVSEGRTALTERVAVDAAAAEVEIDERSVR